MTKVKLDSLRNIQDEFSKIAINFQRQGMVMLFQHNPMTDPALPEYCTLYFSPDCIIFIEEFLRRYKSIKCIRPNKEHVIGLYTNEDFEDVLFK